MKRDQAGRGKWTRLQVRLVVKLSPKTTMAWELFQAIAGDLLGLDWGLRALVRMPEP
jgi:hypothetical protein